MFFVATKKRRRFPISSLNPLVVRQREFVLVAVNNKLVILALKRPAIFRAAIAGIESETPLATSTTEWTGENFRVDGERYFPIPFHSKDAEELASRCQPPTM